jgi:hypothetical protein
VQAPVLLHPLLSLLLCHLIPLSSTTTMVTLVVIVTAALALKTEVVSGKLS